MRHQTRMLAVGLASVVVLGSIGNSWALKGLLKNALQDKAQETPSATQPAETTASPQKTTANSGPVLYNNEKFAFNVELPGKWQQMAGDAKSNTAMFFDQNGNKGSFQVNANWMAEDFPVQSSLQAMEKQYQDRLKHDELVKFYRKDFTLKDKSGKTIAVFQGYVSIETADDPDPDIRRMQWIGYAKGNYYNFTWASGKEQFEAYMPEFEQILGKIQFVQ